MSNTIKPDDWVYVVVQDPGKTETIVGQRDEAHNIDFIPVFKTKDEAYQGVTQMVRTPGQPIEIQAILYEDLLRHAAAGGFLLFMLDGGGRILSKVSPDGRSI